MDFVDVVLATVFGGLLAATCIALGVIAAHFALYLWWVLP